jgi:deazaflavin-dependent oxidoreductase (nitroreductase family)
VVNPVVKLGWGLGIPIPGDALLETTGRRTGLPRRTPVCDGLDGRTFWLIAQRGREADWVRNIMANPRVRVKVSGLRAQWRAALGVRPAGALGPAEAFGLDTLEGACADAGFPREPHPPRH